MKPMSYRLGSCLASLALVLAWPAAAGARELSFSALVSGQIVAEPSFDPLARHDTLALAHLEVGVELDELLEGLSLELAWEAGGSREELFAGDQPWLHSDLLVHGVVLGASWRLPVFAWLRGVVRLGGTVDFARLQLREDGQTLLSDWANGRVGGFATLGAEVILPRNVWRRWFGRPEGDPLEGFTLGLRLELGWSLRQAFVYDQMRGDRGDISRVPADLGSVHLDGFMFRTGLLCVF